MRDRNFFAVFAVAPVDVSGELRIAATTRDGADDGKIGLPGGKVDPGERPVDALLRECAEEGWEVEVPSDADPIHIAVVDGKLVGWYSAHYPTPLADFKEKHRGIRPVLTTLEAAGDSGYGNEWLLGAEYALNHHADINSGII